VIREMSTVELREGFSESDQSRCLRKERVILTRRGRGLPAIVPLEDIKTLKRSRTEGYRGCKKGAQRSGPKGTISLHNSGKNGSLRFLPWLMG